MSAIIIGYTGVAEKKDPILKWIKSQDHVLVMPNFYLVHTARLTALSVWQKLSIMVASAGNKLVVMEAPPAIYCRVDPDTGGWLPNKFPDTTALPVLDEKQPDKQINKELT